MGRLLGGNTEVEDKRIKEITQGRQVVPKLNSAGDGVPGRLPWGGVWIEGGVSKGEGERGAVKDVGEVNEFSVSKMEGVRGSRRK